MSDFVLTVGTRRIPLEVRYQWRIDPPGDVIPRPHPMARIRRQGLEPRTR